MNHIILLSTFKKNTTFKQIFSYIKLHTKI